MSSNVFTFLERDLRQLAQVGDLASFERFLMVTAARTGQVLNISELTKDSGVSPPTAQKLLSILERAYIIRLVQPFYNNLTSRLRKASKIYFLDTGLDSFLMGYRDEMGLLQSPHIGPLFETLVYLILLSEQQTLEKFRIIFICKLNQESGLILSFLKIK